MFSVCWEYEVYYNKTLIIFCVSFVRCVRVATVDLVLINEHKSQGGLHNRKKSAFREKKKYIYIPSGVPRNFFGGEVQQIQLRTKDRENGDLGGR